MWTPAGYMKQNSIEYRLIGTKFNDSQSMLLMVTWDKTEAERVMTELNKILLLNVTMQEVAL
jgi:hypothetical protein